MTKGAPRLLSRFWQPFARGALLTAGLWLALLGTAAAEGAQIQAARYDMPVRWYAHLVLGRDHNWGALEVTLSDGRAASVRLEGLVFEDTAPRLVDLDGDGAPEVLAVESGPREGARLAIYGLREGAFQRLAAAPAIGTGFRWLAIAGAADLDGDGHIEIAYVDRPHLAKTLMVWRWRDDVLELVARHAGVTNHLIGSSVIEGGLRRCDDQVSLILASANWRRIVRLSWQEGGLEEDDLGRYTGEDSLTAARACS